MGAGIAAAHARSGIRTAMVDVDDDRHRRRPQARLGRRHEPDQDRPRHARRTWPTCWPCSTRRPRTTVFADCDVVIEAVTENEAVKKEVYRELAKVIRDDAILASNTSTISITRMAESAPDPERFVGMHFFNPVDRMELVEVIRGEKTSDETVATIVALAKRIRKTPIVVKDCAGFLVNRVLFPYMNESLVLLAGRRADGGDRQGGDAKFGMPMGPIALTDLVGLDTAVLCRQGGRRGLSRPGGDARRSWTRCSRPAAAARSRASGSATSTASGGKPEPNPAVAAIIAKHRTGDDVPMDEDEITDRLFLPMLLEATRVLEEGIVREPGDVDMGLILGIGFPPFRGGILRWCDTIGRRGDRREAARSTPRWASGSSRPRALLKLAKTGETFYPRPKLGAAS